MTKAQKERRRAENARARQEREEARYNVKYTAYDSQRRWAVTYTDETEDGRWRATAYRIGGKASGMNAKGDYRFGSEITPKSVALPVFDGRSWGSKRAVVRAVGVWLYRQAKAAAKAV